MLVAEVDKVKEYRPAPYTHAYTWIPSATLMVAKKMTLANKFFPN